MVVERQALVEVATTNKGKPGASSCIHHAVILSEQKARQELPGVTQGATAIHRS
jgi:hypothetical protein